MRKLRLIALFLAMVLVFSVFVPTVMADHKTGSELFDGISKSEKDEEQLREIYDDLIYRIYKFDEDIMLPNFEDMLDLDEIGYKYVQSKHGIARGQKLYTEPDGEVKWYAKDGRMVKVYAKYKDYSFVELMMDKDETEGTLAWIETSYLVNKWNANLSLQRAGGQ